MRLAITASCGEERMEATEEWIACSCLICFRVFFESMFTYIVEDSKDWIA